MWTAGVNHRPVEAGKMILLGRTSTVNGAQSEFP
jgi:hypothetical protein